MENTASRDTTCVPAGSDTARANLSEFHLPHHPMAGAASWEAAAVLVVTNSTPLPLQEFICFQFCYWVWQTLSPALTSFPAMCKSSRQDIVCISDDWTCQHCSQVFSGTRGHLRKPKVKFKLGSTHSLCARHGRPRWAPSKSILNWLRKGITVCQLPLLVSKLQ